MANFETEVYELLKLFDSSPPKRSATALRLPSEAGPSSRFCRESHDVLTFLTTRLLISWFLVKYHSEVKFFLFSKSGNVYCCSIVSDSARDFATVLRDTCGPYVLQRRRNEYSFNCQNKACFPRIYLSILHK